jgi:hypothetical protein
MTNCGFPHSGYRCHSQLSKLAIIGFASDSLRRVSAGLPIPHSKLTSPRREDARDVDSWPLREADSRSDRGSYAHQLFVDSTRFTA